MTIFDHFIDLTLSPDQRNALEKIKAFLESDTNIFLLKGYAGSGKTTILKGLVKFLQEKSKKFVLMAPTGRAAKVLRDKVGAEAYTIHKSIYNYNDTEDVEEGDSYIIRYKVRNNKDIVDTVFIVDEASMISNTYTKQEFFEFGSGYLLSDLMEFTRVGQQSIRNKIIFVGDPCQLPPVNDPFSLALDADELFAKFNVTVDETTISEVKRQGDTSGILKAAGRLRKSVTSGLFNSFDLRSNGHDLHTPAPEEFLEIWRRAVGTKIIVAYKNATCQRINRDIRELKFGTPDAPISKGDIVIIGANDYKLGLSNGEFAVVNWTSEMVISRDIHLKNRPPVQLTWREVELVFPDERTNSPALRAFMLENFLQSDDYLSSDEMRALYVDFKQRHPSLIVGTEEFKEAMENDRFIHCVKLKYGYAVTCHKAQGGEWDHAFTVWDYGMTKLFDWSEEIHTRTGKTNENFYRWAYTALTRASKSFYSLNPPYFNAYSSMTFVDVQVQDALDELRGQERGEEIELNESIRKLLTKLGVDNEAIPVQDHLIRVFHFFSRKGVEVIGWKKIGYEIRYELRREEKLAVFKTFVNGNNEFKKSFTPIPGQSRHEDFNQELADLFNTLPELTVSRNVVEKEVTQIEFEAEVEERYPFLRELFDDLEIRLKDAEISIKKLDHKQHRERYTFSKGQESATLDFEYKANGHFGRVLVVPSGTNSAGLVNVIKSIILQLKEQ